MMAARASPSNWSGVEREIVVFMIELASSTEFLLLVPVSSAKREERKRL
jgi:hypothetical protein